MFVQIISQDEILEKLCKGGVCAVYKVPNFTTSDSQRVSEILRIPTSFVGTRRSSV